MGAVAMGAVARCSGRRRAQTGHRNPARKQLGQTAGVRSGAGSAEDNDESRLPGAARRRAGRCSGRRKRGRLRALGSVTEAVAPGAGAAGVSGRSGGAGQGRRDALDQLRRGGRHIRQLAEDCGAGNGRAGRWGRFGRRRRAERQRRETAPAAAIMVETSSFPVRCMVLPIVGGERLRPKLASYWSYSSDTCGIYATVTEATADR